MSIKAFDYLHSLAEIEDEVHTAINRVLHSNQLILGEETAEFEREFAKFVGVKHCVAVTSGTTALHLSLLALNIGPGDEVITVSNTCTPTIAAIRLCGATPVFIDIQDDDQMMDTSILESAINKRTRCILPVHLWGNCVNVDNVLEIAKSNNIAVLEDCAQASGAYYKQNHVGTFGDAGCFSFYPTKNLGAYGDAGAIVTNDDNLANKLRKMRMYGYDTSATSMVEGMNARISEIQAAILRIKLPLFPKKLQQRAHIASIYNKMIDNSLIKKPHHMDDCTPSYHQYVIQSNNRKNLEDLLKENEIGYGIHYPMPVHLMPAYAFLGGSKLHLPNTLKSCSDILSLPIHDALSDDDATFVATTINMFNNQDFSN